jgi:hypothetical protein
MILWTFSWQKSKWLAGIKFKRDLEKCGKYVMRGLTELPGANNTWDQAER